MLVVAGETAPMFWRRRTHRATFEKRVFGPFFIRQLTNHPFRSTHVNSTSLRYMDHFLAFLEVEIRLIGELCSHPLHVAPVGHFGKIMEFESVKVQYVEI